MKKEAWFGISIMALVVIGVFVMMPPLSQWTSGHLGLLMLAMIVIAIMLGFPTAFTLMGMGTMFAFFAYYSQNPVLSKDPGYMGPAAAAKLERFVLDSRDERPAAALDIVNNEQGVWGCDTVFRCIDACPKEVRPTDAIVGLRKAIVKNRFQRLLGKTNNED